MKSLNIVDWSLFWLAILLMSFFSAYCIEEGIKFLRKKKQIWVTCEYCKETFNWDKKKPMGYEFCPICGSFNTLYHDMNQPEEF